ncbi:hypothetical protein CYMTET_49194 [Cymbomonas tetramitiformis]|uniref:Methyltransferase domain-containing protein n=1 Tax=Cymbomonas tetramitiformis TaxID=36881 RepID=A0AAE0BQT0_9CHLO|nr:hypothetical protein CYMTET_49194 [Cymbomonas tetramitiformis]
MKQLATKFREQGFLSPVRVLSPDQARTLRADLEAYECDHSLRGNKRFKLHLLTRWAAQLVRHPRILEVVQAILGPDILVWSSDVNIKGPSSDSFFSWHQDATYAGLAPSEDVLTCWLALSPSNERSGCLRFYPESHHQGQLTHTERPAATNLLAFGQTVDLEQLRTSRGLCTSEPVSAELDPGECSFHHFYNVHGSGPNTSTERRVGFAIRYMAAHVRRRIGSQESATLVRGEDRFLHFLHEEAPSADLDEKALEAHAKAMALEDANYFDSASTTSEGAADAGFDGGAGAGAGSDADADADAGSDPEFEEKMRRNPGLFSDTPAPSRLFCYNWADGFEAPFVPATPETVESVCTRVGVSSEDYVLDLGCGDGRFLLHAAEVHGAAGLGVDLDQDLVEGATVAAATRGVRELVQFQTADIFEVSLDGASVIIVFLLPSCLQKIAQRLLPYLQADPKNVVVSINWELPECRGFQVAAYPSDERGTQSIYIYSTSRMPAKSSSK